MPKVDSCVVLDNSTCSCFDGNVDYQVDCFGYQAVSPDDYLKLRNHFEDVTQRLELCLAAPRKCS
jgi:hypothetical protein